LAGVAAEQTFALGAFAGQLAGAANSFSFFAGAFFRRLFKVAAQFHFAEHAFALQFLFKDAERLIYIVVADKYLHVVLVPDIISNFV
jgi:Ser/Thr protein kinase RdoA (MazF antagonist)